MFELTVQIIHKDWINNQSIITTKILSNISWQLRHWAWLSRKWKTQIFTWSGEVKGSNEPRHKSFQDKFDWQGGVQQAVRFSAVTSLLLLSALCQLRVTACHWQCLQLISTINSRTAALQSSCESSHTVCVYIWHCSATVLLCNQKPFRVQRPIHTHGGWRWG